VTFEFLPDANVPVFSFDRDQIKRAVLNLLDNAVAAMSVAPGAMPAENGVVQVTTDFRQDSGQPASGRICFTSGWCGKDVASVRTARTTLAARYAGSTARPTAPNRQTLGWPATVTSLSHWCV